VENQVKVEKMMDQAAVVVLPEVISQAEKAAEQKKHQHQKVEKEKKEELI
jgi:hypothetical protein